jgi:hypothetical protein
MTDTVVLINGAMQTLAVMLIAVPICSASGTTTSKSAKISSKE